MKQLAIAIVLLICAVRLAPAQSSEAPPRFEAADVRVSPKIVNQYFRTPEVRGGRYALTNATMVDLVRTAYEFDADKVLGGPNWIELDRFDIVAKVPEGTSLETRRQMLQTLLAERFKLQVHKDTKPLSTYALVVNKKPQLKEADGTGETGCKPATTAPAGGQSEGSLTMVVPSSSGGGNTTVRYALGPGATVQFVCRNITMAAFAAGLRGMMGTNLGTNPVLDQTGLEGRWNFDLIYSLSLMGMPITGTRVTIFEAVEKLGLKLEEKPIPTPVLVVDRVNRQPTPNPPETAELLPPIPAPTEFEVASIKPSDPNERSGRFQTQPGGRLNSIGMPLRFLIARAFNTSNMDQLVGLPAWAQSDRYDVIAKAASSGPAAPALDNETLAPMVLALLKERLKLAYHTEERTLAAYTLTAAKPKMKKADPDSRIFCKTGNAPAGSPQGSTSLTCQNVTMAQFAERLQGTSSELTWPVTDSTGLEGTWDFTLIYSRSFGMATNAVGARSVDGSAGAAPVPTASEPTGTLTIFEALEKQLGLKLTTQKRPLPVYVIDHIEKPTEN